ncbi:MAG: hypothetical protein ACLR8P_16710 [Clostridium fessum]
MADVNIPVGEVFTSPQLAGTNGLLHVGSVYIGEFQFRDLPNPGLKMASLSPMPCKKL